jgi:phosphoribosylglycinamide formyltransferase-1
VKIIVFFSGTGSNLESIIHQQKTYSYKVTGSFCNNPDAAGIKISEDHNIACYVLNSKNFDDRNEYDKKISDYLEAQDFDYIILAGYMRILSKFFVQNLEGQIINIHPSLLPKYPGLDTHKRALENKDKYHGTTIHYVTEELDEGPIIRQESIEIEPNESIESLKERVKSLENKIYPETIGTLII